MKSRPAETEYHGSFKGYVARVPETDVVPVLESQVAELGRLAVGVPAARETYRYGEGKWSIREVIGHLIDSERVFAYRALCISRGDQVSLPGFEENDYAAAAHSDDRTLADLIAEFIAVRKANMFLFRSLTDAEWERLGRANENPVSVRALAFIMAGHVRHHIAVLRDRYGIGSGT